MFNIEEYQEAPVGQPVVLFEGEYVVEVPPEQKAVVVFHKVDKKEKPNDEAN